MLGVPINDNNCNSNQIRNNINFRINIGLLLPLIYLEYLTNLSFNLNMNNVNFQNNVGYKANFFIFDYIYKLIKNRITNCFTIAKSFNYIILNSSFLKNWNYQGLISLILYAGVYQ